MPYVTYAIVVRSGHLGGHGSAIGGQMGGVCGQGWPVKASNRSYLADCARGARPSTYSAAPRVASRVAPTMAYTAQPKRSRTACRGSEGQLRP